jgi:hypothetical protein
MPVDAGFVDAPGAPARFARRVLAAFKWALLIAGFIAVAIILAGVGYDVHGSLRLRDARRAARSALLPLSYDEWLRAEPEIPDAMNAALYYEAAFSLMRVRVLPQWFEEVFPETYKKIRTETRAAREVEAALLDPREPISPEVLAEVKTLVDARRDILAAVHDGADLSRSRYPVEWDLYMMPRPYFEPMRTTVPLVMLAAWVAAEEDRPADSVASIRDAVALSRSFSGQPDLGLARREHEGVANALDVGLARVLARGPVRNEDLELLGEDLARYDAEYPALRALEGILALDCDLRLALWEGRKSIQREGANVVPAFLLRGYLKADEALLINYFLCAFKERGDPVRPPRFYYQAHMRSIQLDAMLDEIRSTRALLRAGIVACAAARYKNDTGKWPEALSGLVPAYIPDLPGDPFGASLLYAPTDDGVVIYSLGPNRKDDSGRPDLIPAAPRAADGSGQADDVGVRLWNPGR